MGRDKKMIELSLQKKEFGENIYRQDFPNGYIIVSLSKTPTSEVFNQCYVEIGADKQGSRYRVWDSEIFRTEKAYDRAINWINEFLGNYKNIFLNKI